MKISKANNKLFFCLIASTLTGIFVSCGSTQVAPEPVPEEPKIEEPAPVVEEPAPVVEEPAPEEPAPIEEEPVVETQEPPADDEYSRSVGDVQVSRDTFLEDKEKVLQIISELDNIMKKVDYNSWLKYVEPASIEYWKLRKNLQRAEKRLPVKGIKLYTMQDYFKQVFIPVRKGREITEIRYVSDIFIKAVQIQQKENAEAGKTEEQVTVYYYFNKVNDNWMVHLPTNEDLD